MIAGIMVAIEEKTGQTFTYSYCLIYFSINQKGKNG